MVAGLQLAVGYGCGSPSAIEETGARSNSEGKPATVHASDSCADVDAWIEENQGRLPSEYDAILQFPDQYRRAIFATQSADVQSALWQTQFERYRVQHAPLTVDQSAVLEFAADLVSPELFTMPQEEAASLVARVLEPRVIEAFGVDEGRALLGQLGPVDPASVAVTALPDCICNIQADYCAVWVPGSKCTYGVIPCTFRSRGCGGTLLSPCNGFCT